MRPCIGITGDFAAGEGSEKFILRSEYFDVIFKTGGVPILLPPFADDETLKAQFSCVNALFITGGGDISSARYGQPQHPACTLVHPRREAHDFQCVRHALDLRIPILGVCYGMQVINVALGGTLIQDIPSPSLRRRPGERTAHSVSITPDTRLSRIVKATRIDVNSTHHQAVGQLGKDLVIASRSDDNIIEAIEGTGDEFLLGVQWHPERLMDSPDQRAIFQSFIEAAGVI